MAWRWLQSHMGQVRRKGQLPVGYHSDLANPGNRAWLARRPLLRAAVFGTRDQEFWAYRPAVPRHVVTGVIADVRPGGIVLYSRSGLQTLDLAPTTVTWLGAEAAPSALRAGDPVIVRRANRHDAASPLVAERIWARIGRVTGTIVAADGREFLVDVGRHDRPPRRVVIAKAALRQIQVRYPRLEPGYLLDVIGTRRSDYLLAVTWATAQPPYRAGHPPRPPRVGGHIPVPISGTAVWHEPDGESPDLLGLAYPAVAPESIGPWMACPGDASGTGCVRLPYLSLGSAVRIHNECTERAAVLPVTSDGAAARQFCDRCLTCGTSQKGRIADLTMAAFAELGGNLEDGCFNATLTLAV
jgi:hypothetical protein